MTGNNDVRDKHIVGSAELHLTIAPDATVDGAMPQQPQPCLQDEPCLQDQPCLRDNECSQQQLLRLVGYRSPVTASISWDRLRREQAALLAG